MADHPVFAQLISELLHALGKSEQALADDESRTLVFDEKVVLSIDHDPVSDAIVFFSVLSDIPESDSAQWHRRLLAANLFWHDTEGATLAIDDENSVAVLLYREPLAGLDLPVLQAVVERFVNLADSWMDRLEEWKAETAQENSESTDALPSTGIRV